eukprot:SAG31_NODE_3637_length_4035_cov_1.699695_1_plen_195_part_00
MSHALLWQPCALYFVNPVSAKDVPDYHSVVKNPICLRQIKDKVRKHCYIDFKHFELDLLLIVENCTTYNTGKASAWLIDQASELWKVYQKLCEQHATALQVCSHLAQNHVLDLIMDRCGFVRICRKLWLQPTPINRLRPCNKPHQTQVATLLDTLHKPWHQCRQATIQLVAVAGHPTQLRQRFREEYLQLAQRR